MSDKQTPLQQAIALTYEVGESAPRVVAKGRGVIAQRIIEEAKAHNVFVHESKELVALLMQVNLDDHIPPALYTAIAEVLAWLYQLENGIDTNEAQPPSTNLITL
ncbi:MULTISPECIES: EscU/YscU/HrcU family type III secretion system export apparatus switch protein [Methylotenera]|uniref:EscU/YscU/HrcU family type III secretion system export apparatus switch protein n=1 Tax=Methylotenera TaxID=359407 RepID=UPI00035C9882|nr:MULTISPECIES: EscU/YscU/HrcU family type III secretion system export apparatus switch protein [Methylotenera]